MLDYYTCAMSQATTPHDAKELFTKINKPFIMLTADLDEQFDPLKTLTYADYAKGKGSSHWSNIAQVTHFSILFEAVDTIDHEIITLTERLPFLKK
jgi:hypothetical protein